MSFCGQCATPMSPAMINGKERPRCPACGFVLWRNPAPVGMALIEHDGELVLIRRREAPLAGFWAPPAGYVECGESVPDASVPVAKLAAWTMLVNELMNLDEVLCK